MENSERGKEVIDILLWTGFALCLVAFLFLAWVYSGDKEEEAEKGLGDW